MIGIWNAIVESGTVGYIIVALGTVALGLIIERVKVLYFDYAIKESAFMKQVTGLIMNDQIEDAITYCTANKKAPLAHTIKGVLERADRDDTAINQGLDIALAEVIPGLSRRLGFLSMLANVATLLGLLGTIQGLILAFDAVAAADAAQKSQVLAQGIAIAMYTTAIGLSVAIPVLGAYSFLHARQGRLLETISEHSAKVVDLLTTRHYQPFNKNGAFPRDLGEAELARRSKGEPPPPHVKSAG